MVMNQDRVIQVSHFSRPWLGMLAGK